MVKLYTDIFNILSIINAEDIFVLDVKDQALTRILNVLFLHMVQL